LYLDLTPQYSIASLAMRDEPVDATYLRSAIAAHASGLQVLAAPKQPQEADVVDVSCVDSVVQLLRSEFDWVVWDTPSDLDERSLFILDHADCVLLVTTPDVPALNRTRVEIELLDNLGRGEGAVRIVVNRTEARASVSMREAKEFLGRPIDAHLPNDYQRASACVNEGRTVDEMAPRSPLGRAVSELAGLAHSWCDRTPPPVEKQGFFSRLRGK
jgi:pilus assembly protein CpaE